jgi:hypothetical protein
MAETRRGVYSFVTEGNAQAAASREVGSASLPKTRRSQPAEDPARCGEPDLRVIRQLRPRRGQSWNRLAARREMQVDKCSASFHSGGQS